MDVLVFAGFRAAALFRAEAPRLPPKDSTTGRSSNPSSLREDSRSAASTSPRTGLPVTTQLTELSKYFLASGTASITVFTDLASILVVTPG